MPKRAGFYDYSAPNLDGLVKSPKNVIASETKQSEIAASACGLLAMTFKCNPVYETLY
jgi:hypothetical protein